MMAELSSTFSFSETSLVSAPLVTRERWAAMCGLPIGVVNAQIDRGMWGSPVRIGKYSLVNVEAIRIAAARKADEFKL